MTNNRSTHQAIRLASIAILSTLLLSACVQTLDFYDDEYYPSEQTVVVKHPRPVYHHVDVYETRPTVIVSRPAPYYYGPHYYDNAPHVSAQVLIRPKPHHHKQHHTTIVKPYSQREEVNTTVVKDYRHSSQSRYPAPPSTTSVETRYQNNYETHDVQPPSSTTVKHPKKIVIQSTGDAPPSTLAE